MKPFVIIWLTFWSCSLWSQVADVGKTYRMQLQDGTPVQLFSGWGVENQHNYYYMPLGLRLSTKTDGTPEFSFMTYAEEEGQAPSGAILHMLLVWGLKPGQDVEIQNWLRTEVDSLAILRGVIGVEQPSDGHSFRITGEGPIADLLRNRLSTPPVAPVLPGTKLALSYRFGAEETALFEEALKNAAQLKAVTFELIFTFRGGNPVGWHNVAKRETCYLSANLKQLLQPALNPVKKTK